jgi:hypothetical protein
MHRRRAWAVVGAVVVMLGCMRGTAMAKMVLWSAMKGRVSMNGQPAAGAALVSSYLWHWNNEKASDQAVANAAGELAFPVIEGRSLPGNPLPQQPVIEQLLKVEYLSRSYVASR